MATLTFTDDNGITYTRHFNADLLDTTITNMLDIIGEATYINCIDVTIKNPTYGDSTYKLVVDCETEEYEVFKE